MFCYYVEIFSKKNIIFIVWLKINDTLVTIGVYCILIVLYTKLQDLSLFSASHARWHDLSFFPRSDLHTYINNAIADYNNYFSSITKTTHASTTTITTYPHTLQSICIHKLEEEYYYVLLHTADLTICLSDHVLGRRSGRPIT